MSQFDSILTALKAEPYATKKQLLEYMIHMAQTLRQRKRDFDPADKAAILEYAWGEVNDLLLAIPNAATYKEKDLIFTCEDLLLGLVMHLCPTADQIPQEHLAKIQLLVEVVKKERYIENALDALFQRQTIAEPEVRDLLALVERTEDEYQRGMLYSGLVHYTQDISKFSADAKALMTAHLTAEMKRYLDMDQPGEDCINCLELMADVSRYFADDTLIGLLYDVLSLGHNNVNFFMVDTLLALKKDVPQAVIDALARDLQYANLAYGTLKEHGKQVLFPADCATPEYRAKSDLVHWLMYPTELGQAPDEIEFIGKVTYLFKKDVYYVFRYRSGSDTLDDEVKNKWLIGWSSENGGTFSNFDLYANYEKATTEATLKNIKKKLIG